MADEHTINTKQAMDDCLEGGCLCGAIRYRTKGKPFAAEYCHCGMCRKHNGAVVVNWMDFNTEQVTWLCGQTTEYASSETVRRGFCANCGSTLQFRDTRYPQYTTLTIGSLDDANLVKPNHHIYVEDQVSWLNISDNCKRFTKEQLKDSD